MSRPDATDRARAAQAAAALWPTMTPGERWGVRYGLIPQAVALKAVAEYGRTTPVAGVEPPASEPYADFPRLFATALMDEAARDGGMFS